MIIFSFLLVLFVFKLIYNFIKTLIYLEMDVNEQWYLSRRHKREIINEILKNIKLLSAHIDFLFLTFLPFPLLNWIFFSALLHHHFSLLQGFSYNMMTLRSFIPKKKKNFNRKTVRISPLDFSFPFRSVFSIPLIECVFGFTSIFF